MNVGIVIYSETGNTKSVAQKAQERIGGAGHDTEILEVKADKSRLKLTDLPPVDGYDMLCLGSPVHALTLANPMKLFLKELPPLDGERVTFFATQALPFSWLGGNRAMRVFHRAVVDKTGKPLRAGTVHWASRGKDQEIEAIVTTIVQSIDS